MNIFESLFAVLILLGIFLPGTISAQVLGPDIRVTPRIGAYAGAGDLLVVRPTGNSAAVSLRVAPSPVLGLGIEAGLPVSWLRLRGVVERSFGGDLELKSIAGDESCGANCVRIVYDTTPVTSASILAAAADLVLDPVPSSWAVRPYAAAGLGVKHFSFDRGDVPAGTIAAENTHVALHLGLGIGARIRGVELFAEASGYDSDVLGFGGPLSPDGDLFAVFGVRVRSRSS